MDPLLQLDDHVLVHREGRHVQHRVVQVRLRILDAIDLALQLCVLILEHAVLRLTNLELLVEVSHLGISLSEESLELRAAIRHFLIALPQILDRAFNLILTLQLDLHVLILICILVHLLPGFLKILFQFGHFSKFISQSLILQF